jgi:ATP-dependent RNA helicase DDX51/DBP6
MFAARFDPNAIVEDIVEDKPKVLPLKRKRDVQDDSDDDDDDDEGSDKDQEMNDAVSDSDASSSDNDSDSDSDSDSDNDSDSSDDESAKEVSSDNIQQVSTSESDEVVEPIIQEHDTKHSSIISRFTKSIKKSTTDEVSSSEDDEENQPEESHDLAPLPQPALPRDRKLSRQSTAKNLNWLSTPLYISPRDLKPFDEFKQLNPKIKSNLQSLGFNNAFATQIKTLEILLPEISNSLNPLSSRGDLLVNASTGSGKTLAYSIPIVQSLIARVVPKLRAVIIVPTKPLIQQVYQTLNSISRGFDLNIVTLGGGANLSINEEHEKLLKNVPDVLVTTPGRFVEHLNLKSIDLKNLRFLIIDEADRLLNQSFQDWLNVLFAKLDETFEGNDSVLKVFKRGLIKMIFSATLTTDSGKLTNLKFNNPRLIIVNDEDSILTNDKIFTLPLNLKEYQLRFPSKSNSLKPVLLLEFLTLLHSPNALIFTKSNESALRLTKLLKILIKNYDIQNFSESSIANINSELSTSAKSKILQDFTKGDSIKFLISTDLIARGIDIASIKNVINYDLPNSSREYVHRVGRTARAGNEGNAYSFIVGKGEEKFWKNLNLDINRTDEITDAEGIDNDTVKEKYDIKIYEESLKELEKFVFSK